MRKSFRVLLITLHALKKGNQFVKKTLCLILTLLTFVTLAFAPNAFAQDTSLDYVVRTIYFVPKDRESNPDMDRKLDALMKSAKQFYADLMEYHGFGEKTFRLETDATGNTIVHHVTGKFDNAYYQNPEERNGSLIVWEEIEEQFDTSKNIYVLVLDTSDGIVIGDRNPAGLGSGGSHNGYVLLPAHNYNAASHELGHAFGLPHDSRIDASRWTARSSDPMITSFCAAEWLDVNRYFNPIQEASVDNKPSFQMSAPSLVSAPRTIRLQFEVADPDGLHQVQLFRLSDKGGPSTFNYRGVIACKKLDGKTTTVEFVTSELTVLNPRVLLRLIDVHGNFTASQSFDLDLTDLLPQTEMISIPDPNLSSTATVPKDGLLVHYTFEETEGTTAADVSGNGNNATLTGNAGWYPTGALQLDGSNNTSAVDEDAENYLNGLTAITIALWVKADTTGHNSGFIYGSWTTSNVQDRSLVLRYNQRGNRGFNVITAVVPTVQRTYQRYESASDVQTTEWQHITLTWSSGNQIALYINGELDVPTYNDQLTVGSVLHLSRLLIGQSGFDQGTSWRGLIDEVLIYNRVLTQQEITDLIPEQSESTVSDPTTHSVVFSEVMFESEGGTDGLPQWIEVYNSSNSEINLRDWKLQWKRLQPSLSEVTTAFSPDGTLLATASLPPSPLEVTTTFNGEFIIPAQQSRLIVTDSGRYGDSKHGDKAKLSDDDVYPLHLFHTVELGQNDVANRNRLITRGGFSLKLINAADVLVDQIGTLVDDKHTWQLPECLIEGVRSSLIRRFDKGVPRSGTEHRGWIRAIDIQHLVAGIYYGNQHDLGTPGYRRGKPLPVELSHFSARFVKDEVVINWTTESELNNAGFNVLRSTSRTKNFRPINPKLIQGAGTTGERNEYTWTDTTAKPNTVYYYQIEDVSHAGVRKQLATVRLRGLVSASGKFTTRWADLKSENP